MDIRMGLHLLVLGRLSGRLTYYYYLWAANGRSTLSIGLANMPSTQAHVGERQTCTDDVSIMKAFCILKLSLRSLVSYSAFILVAEILAADRRLKTEDLCYKASAMPSVVPSVIPSRQLRISPA